MSVSFVNGYTCFSSCDEANARSGKDPNPKPPGLGEDPAKSGIGSIDRGEAVLFGGVLADVNFTRPTDKNSSGANPTIGSTIDILA